MSSNLLPQPPKHSTPNWRGYLTNNKKKVRSCLNQIHKKVLGLVKISILKGVGRKFIESLKNLTYIQSCI